MNIVEMWAQLNRNNTPEELRAALAAVSGLGRKIVLCYEPNRDEKTVDAALKGLVLDVLPGFNLSARLDVYNQRSWARMFDAADRHSDRHGGMGCMLGGEQLWPQLWTGDFDAHRFAVALDGLDVPAGLAFYALHPHNTTVGKAWDHYVAAVRILAERCPSVTFVDSSVCTRDRLGSQQAATRQALLRDTGARLVSHIQMAGLPGDWTADEIAAIDTMDFSGQLHARRWLFTPLVNWPTLAPLLASWRHYLEGDRARTNEERER